LGKFLKSLVKWLVSHPEVAEVIIGVVKAKTGKKSA
jgi:hypothetical protein